MEYAYIIIELLKVLAWPSVVVFIAIFFRASFMRLLNGFNDLEIDALGIKIRGTNQTPGEMLKSEGFSSENNYSLPDRIIPTRLEIVEASMRALADYGVKDPNLKLFLAAFKNDKDETKEAIESGADLNITDTQVLNKYSKQLSQRKIKDRVNELVIEIMQKKQNTDKVK